VAVVSENKQTLLTSVIASHFQAFLDRYAFKEDAYMYDHINFGNEVLRLRSADFCLLFINGRGCLEIKLCPEPVSTLIDSFPLRADRSIDISIFLEFIGHPIDLTNVKNYQGIVQAEDLAPVYAEAIEAHFETVLDLLGLENFKKTRIQFDAFLEERGPRMFPGLYGRKV
jgi:hypothetical protein